MNEQTYREHLNDLQVEIEELRAKLKESQTGDTISRQAAIDMAVDMYNGGGIVQATYSDIGKALVKFLNLVPSAQPEIVRCKDCKCGDWYTAIDGNRYCYCMETGNGGRTEDDYCSYAERITE